MLGIFPVLAFLAFLCIVIFLFRFIVPMWRQHELSLSDHKLPIGLALICTGIFGETLIYGLGRFLPKDYVQFSNIYSITLTLKIAYMLGLTFLVSWDAKIRKGRSVIRKMLFLVIASWLLMSLFIATV